MGELGAQGRRVAIEVAVQPAPRRVGDALTTVDGGYSGQVVALRSIGSTRASALRRRSAAFSRRSAETSSSVIPSNCR
jgi:hypothetical protein